MVAGVCVVRMWKRVPSHPESGKWHNCLSAALGRMACRDLSVLESQDGNVIAPLDITVEQVLNSSGQTKLLMLRYVHKEFHISYLGG